MTDAERRQAQPLSHPEFRRFWLGGLVTNSGVWMQNVSIPFVIYERTGSATLVGLTGFLMFLPGIVFSPVGGWLADRYPRRLVLIVTQSAHSVVALGLWTLYTTGTRNTPVLLALVFTSGIVQGLSVPAWQAFVPELVPREALARAVTLNSAQFNAGRAVGPAMAGVILARYGASWTFLINACTYLAVIGALLSIRPARGAVARPKRRAMEQMRHSARVMRSQRPLFVSVGIMCAMAALGHPLFQLMPVFATEVFHVGPARYGIMLASLGTGGVIGAIAISRRAPRGPRGQQVFRAIVVYAGAIFVFGLAPTDTIAIASLLIAGAAYLLVTASLNTSVQLVAPEQLRGGIMSIYVMGFHIAYPIGSLGLGALVEIAPPRAVVVCVALVIATGAVVLRRRGIFEAIADDDERQLPDDAVVIGPEAV